MTLIFYRSKLLLRPGKKIKHKANFALVQLCKIWNRLYHAEFLFGIKEPRLTTKSSTNQLYQYKRIWPFNKKVRKKAKNLNELKFRCFENYCPYASSLPLARHSSTRSMQSDGLNSIPEASWSAMLQLIQRNRLSILRWDFRILKGLERFLTVFCQFSVIYDDHKYHLFDFMMIFRWFWTIFDHFWTDFHSDVWANLGHVRHSSVPLILHEKLYFIPGPVRRSWHCRHRYWNGQPDAKNGDDRVLPEPVWSGHSKVLENALIKPTIYFLNFTSIKSERHSALFERFNHPWA